MEILESRFDSLQLNGHGHMNGGHAPISSSSVSLTSANSIYLPSNSSAQVSFQADRHLRSGLVITVNLNEHG